MNNFNIYREKFLLSDKYQISNNDECVCLSSVIFPGKRYYRSDDVYNKTIKYIRSKLSSCKNPLTDIGNSVQMIKALNVLYLDGDFTFSDYIEKEKYEQICIDLSITYLNYWKTQLNNENYKDYYYFIFVPNEFPNNKGGFHIFVYLRDDVSVDLRMKMYTNIKNNFDFDILDDIDNIEGVEDCVNYEKIFDIGPLKTMCCLIPFAEKHNAKRRYKLIQTTFNKQDYFINSQRHSIFSDDDYIDKKSLLDDSELDDKLKEINQILSSDYKKKDCIAKFGKVGTIILEFISSLEYLSKEHKFWDLLIDNDLRLKKFVNPLLKYIHMNYFIEHRGYIDNDDYCLSRHIEELARAVTITIQPLIKRACLYKNKIDTESYTYKSCFNHALSWANKYGTKTMFRFRSKEDKEYDLVTFYKNYSRMSDKERKRLTPKDLVNLDILKNICCKVTNNWTIFVKKIIMLGITTEIEPFRRVDNINDDPRTNIDFEEVLPKQMSMNSINDAIYDTFYIKTLRKWSMMFFFISYYNTKQVTEAIREVLNAFIKYYICIDQENKKNEPSLMIYNVKQTRSLTSYPYNQWLRDDKTHLEDWIISLYTYLISPELETVNMPYGLNPLLNNLNNACIPIGDNVIKNLKPIANIGIEISKIVKNSIKTYMQERFDPPKKLQPAFCKYFPMRNGMLKFKNNGEYIFLKNNHHHYMPAGTNVFWEENYNIDCDEYKNIKTMIEQIYPVEEERIYNMRLFSTVLHGIGTRDLIHIMYGTGADGKTTMINAIQAMLGNEAFNTNVETFENGKWIRLNNIKGLSSTMKPDVLLISNKNSHDEGGKIELRDVRLCNIQEPDYSMNGGNINGANAKEITSGGPQNAREIYGASTTFVANCLITFQLNFIPGTDDTSDGFKRRMSFYTHLSKFYGNEVTLESYDKIKYKYPANTFLAKNLISNPKYWQALFYYLLPYAQEVLKNKWVPISSIPKPQSVLMGITQMLSNTSGISGWLWSHIVPTNTQEFTVMNVKSLIKLIIERNFDSKNNRFLKSFGELEQQKEICSGLQAHCVGRIYKLRDEFYTNIRRNRYTLIWSDDELPIETIGMFKEQMLYEDLDEQITDNEFINKYLYEMGNTTVSVSKMNDKSDLYIIGYKLDLDYNS